MEKNNHAHAYSNTRRRKRKEWRRRTARGKVCRYNRLWKNFNIFRTVLIRIILVGNQLDAQFLLQSVQIKSGPILIWVIYLLRFTTCYTCYTCITELTCIYSKCWKWCSFISMHVSTRFTMFLATLLSVLSVFNHFRKSTFYWRLPSKFFKINTRSPTVNRIMKA
jgi:hypothetical protein